MDELRNYANIPIERFDRDQADKMIVNIITSIFTAQQEDA